MKTAKWAIQALKYLVKLIDSCLKLDDKTICKILKFLGYTFVVVGGVITVFYWGEKLLVTKANKKTKEAEGDLYYVKRMADAELYRAKKRADARYSHTPHPENKNEEKGNESGEVQEEVGCKKTWIESFNAKFHIPQLPPFLYHVMSIVPGENEAAMLLHICSMLGAMCFSKVRAKYNDLEMHAPNLQVIVEGNWGSGKGRFEVFFKRLFSRIIDSSNKKIELLDKPENQGKYIVQVLGLGTSMAKTVDIMAGNQGCHAYLFNSEVRALGDDLKKGNGISYDFLRKAFENGDVCRINRAKDSKNGIFPIFLNYTLTGTPNDISTTFRKELEGGTLSRICWCTIPKQGRKPSKLIIPYGVELESLRDQIDGWREKYCFHTTQNGDVAVDVYSINLDYVNDALDEWCKKQYDQAKEENNTARADVRLRIGTIAFHCAIIFHMLFGEPDSEHKKERKQVVDLTLYVANYCMERFLHKFGKEQNEQHKKNQEAELVDATEPMVSSSVSTPEKLYRGIPESVVKCMSKDYVPNEFGLGSVAKKYGYNPKTDRDKIKNAILEYRKEHN